VSDLKPRPDLAPTIGRSLKPKRQTSWIRAEPHPAATCDGVMIGEHAIADPCGWQRPGIFPMSGAELKREAIRHAEQTGHVVIIEQVTRTVISPADARDVLVDGVE
jgi:hypothetical protein